MNEVPLDEEVVAFRARAVAALDDLAGLLAERVYPGRESHLEALAHLRHEAASLTAIHFVDAIAFKLRPVVGAIVAASLAGLLDLSVVEACEPAMACFLAPFDPNAFGLDRPPRGWFHRSTSTLAVHPAFGHAPFEIERVPVGDEEEEEQTEEPNDDAWENDVDEEGEGDAPPIDEDVVVEATIGSTPPPPPPKHAGEFRLDDETRPPVDGALLPEGGAAISRGEVRAKVLRDAFDVLTLAIDKRARSPIAETAYREREAAHAVDAIATDPRWIDGVVEAMASRLDDATESRWAAAIHALAAGASTGPLLAIEAVMRAAPRGHEGFWEGAGEALAIAPHPSLAEAITRMRRADHPFVRAASTYASLLRAPDPEVVAIAFDDPNGAVVAAGLRGASLLEAPLPLERLAPFLSDRRRGVAFEAARTITRARSDAPLRAILEGGAIVAALGERVVEPFVWSADRAALEKLPAIVRRLRPTPSLLDAVARVGAPATWQFLAHHVDDDVLGDAAHAALTRLFGALVEVRPKSPPTALAWRHAIAAKRFDPAIRTRHGAPWTPMASVAEVTSLRASRRDGVKLVDELIARTSVRAPVRFHGWSDVVRADVETLARYGADIDARLPAGSWGRV